MSTLRLYFLGTLDIRYERIPLLVKPWVRKYLISAIGWWFWKDVIIEPH